MGVSNYLPSSRLIQPGVCTSTTRPASPFEGQAIFETDTDKVLYWNGSGWYPAWNRAWGVIAISELTDGTTRSGNPSDITSVTFTHVAGRRIQLSAFGRLGFTSTASAGEIRDGTTRLTYQDALSSSFHINYNSIVVASSSSSKSYNFRLHLGASSTITVANNFTFMATDIGPA